MTTKRIRCSCGRVYDPVKRPAARTAAQPMLSRLLPNQLPRKRPLFPSRLPDEPVSPRSSPTPINPRIIAIGGAVLALLLVVVMLSRRGGKEKSAAIVPSPARGATSASRRRLRPTTLRLTSPRQSRRRKQPSRLRRPRHRNPGADARPAGVSHRPRRPYRESRAQRTDQSPTRNYRKRVLTRPIQLVGEGNKQVLITGCIAGKESLVVKTTGASVQNIQILCEGIGALARDLRHRRCEPRAWTPAPCSQHRRRLTRHR